MYWDFIGNMDGDLKTIQETKIYGMNAYNC